MLLAEGSAVSMPGLSRRRRSDGCRSEISDSDDVDGGRLAVVKKAPSGERKFAI